MTLQHWNLSVTVSLENQIMVSCRNLLFVREQTGGYEAAFI